MTIKKYSASLQKKSKRVSSSSETYFSYHKYNKKYVFVLLKITKIERKTKEEECNIQVFL